MKKALLAKYGGTATTEAAVGRALGMAQTQSAPRRQLEPDRSVSPTAVATRIRTAATAMALIAFQGDGHTHDDGEYQEQVAAAGAHCSRCRTRTATSTWAAMTNNGSTARDWPRSPSAKSTA